MKKPTILTAIIGAAITATLIYGYAYIAGKGWKQSQK